MTHPPLPPKKLYAGKTKRPMEKRVIAASSYEETIRVYNRLYEMVYQKPAPEMDYLNGFVIVFTDDHPPEVKKRMRLSDLRARCRDLQSRLDQRRRAAIGDRP